MTDDKPKFYVKEIYPSMQGLHFKFASVLEAQKFYLHLQQQGAKAVLREFRSRLHMLRRLIISTGTLIGQAIEKSKQNLLN